MSITLQSTVGGFSDGFLRRLPALEAAMQAQGLEPSSFVLSKDRATPVTVPWVGPFFYDYTVFIGDEHFTVTEPDDSRFLQFLHDRIVAPDDGTDDVDARSAPNWFSRMLRWMNQPV